MGRMRYRAIPRLGIQAGVVGLGGEHLDGRPYAQVERTVHAALGAGMNMLDVFMPGEEIRSHIGRALKGRRGDMMIQGMIGSVDTNKQYDISRDLSVCKRYFEGLLRALGTDYIDFGMLFFVDTQEAYEKVFEGDILPYALRLKEAGTIRGLGASVHDPIVARRMAETGLLDLIMFSVNPAFDLMPAGVGIDAMLEPEAIAGAGGVQPSRMEFYRACERNGVAVTTMKTLASGKLLTADYSPFSAPLSVPQCIAYALDRPAVVSALIGCRDEREVEEAVRFFDTPEKELAYAETLGGERGNFHGCCVYCGHCAPCPKNIDVAAVHRCIDTFEVQCGSGAGKAPNPAADRYAGLKGHGSDCIGCGSCEARCPFGVPIVGNMARAAALFGK